MRRYFIPWTIKVLLIWGLLLKEINFSMEQVLSIKLPVTFLDCKTSLGTCTPTSDAAFRVYTIGLQQSLLKYTERNRQSN